MMFIAIFFVLVIFLYILTLSSNKDKEIGNLKREISKLKHKIDRYEMIDEYNENYRGAK